MDYYIRKQDALNCCGSYTRYGEEYDSEAYERIERLPEEDVVP